MFEKVRQNLLGKVAFTETEISSIVERLKEENIPRKKLLLFNGSTCDFVAYILDGCVRSYTIPKP